MLSDEDRQVVADQLYRAERERAYVRPITETFPDADIRDAYAIAQMVTSRKIASGSSVKGHKIGLVSKPMQELAGSTEPDFGTLFDDQFLPEDSDLSLSSLNTAVGPSAEIELAFVMRTALRGPGVTPADVISAVDYVLPAIEVVDRRYEIRRGPGPIVVDSVADGAWCGRVILGSTPRRLTDLDVKSVRGALSVNGQTRAEGLSAAVLGSPINSVTWLANTLGRMGVGIEAGHVVMSGSFIALVPLQVGDRFSAVFDQLGEIRFNVVE